MVLGHKPSEAPSQKMLTHVGDLIHIGEKPGTRKVKTIFGGSHEVGDSQRMRDKYAREVKTLPLAVVQAINGSGPRETMPKSKDIVFTETDAS